MRNALHAAGPHVLDTQHKKDSFQMAGLPPIGPQGMMVDDQKPKLLNEVLLGSSWNRKLKTVMRTELMSDERADVYLSWTQLAVNQPSLRQMACMQLECILKEQHSEIHTTKKSLPLLYHAPPLHHDLTDVWLAVRQIIDYESHAPIAEALAVDI